jgi:hypothetical protein
MADWVAPTIAASLALIALCVVALSITVLAALREGRKRSTELGQELGDLRKELSPAIAALTAFSESGAELAGITHDEVEELAATSAVLRHEVHHGLRQARRRLDDFDALVEVLQEEVEEAAIDVAVALRTVRTTRGVLGQLGRFLVPGRRDKR